MNTSQKPTITAEEVQKIARLARLAVDDAAVQRHVKNLSGILKLIAGINDQSTEGITALTTTLDSNLPLRDDQVTATNEREVLQKLAPDTKYGFYLVPHVIE